MMKSRSEPRRVWFICTAHGWVAATPAHSLPLIEGEMLRQQRAGVLIPRVRIYENFAALYDDAVPFDGAELWWTADFDIGRAGEMRDHAAHLAIVAPTKELRDIYGRVRVHLDHEVSRMRAPVAAPREVEDF